MTSDEQAIRDLVATWIRATAEEDLPRILSLMADDVVFLTAGREPFGRKEFEAGFKAMQGRASIQGSSEIQEIQASGDIAWCWNKLSVTITPLGGGAPKSRSAHVLSVLRREPAGNWVIARDANLLGEAQ